MYENCRRENLKKLLTGKGNPGKRVFQTTANTLRLNNTLNYVIKFIIRIEKKKFMKIKNSSQKSLYLEV